MVTELSHGQKFPSGNNAAPAGTGEGDLRASPLHRLQPIVLLCHSQGVQGNKQHFPSWLRLRDGFLNLLDLYEGRNPVLMVSAPARVRVQPGCPERPLPCPQVSCAGGDRSEPTPVKGRILLPKAAQGPSAPTPQRGGY